MYSMIVFISFSFFRVRSGSYETAIALQPTCHQTDQVSIYFFPSQTAAVKFTVNDLAEGMVTRVPPLRPVFLSHRSEVTVRRRKFARPFARPCIFGCNGCCTS